MKTVKYLLLSLFSFLLFTGSSNAVEVSLIGFKPNEKNNIDKECIVNQIKPLLSIDKNCLKLICWGPTTKFTIMNLKTYKRLKMKIDENLYLYINFFAKNTFYLSSKDNEDSIYCYGMFEGINLYSCLKF